MPDNTRSLIITGIFTVTLPVAIALLGPVAAAAIWVLKGNSFFALAPFCCDDPRAHAFLFCVPVRFAPLVELGFATIHQSAAFQT